MPLDDYRRKRDFSRSPEPPAGGRRRRRGAGPMFCVQKHLASHLHYDFRLEHDGVLLSWAVPKGPSLDPSVKRYAVHVEDHPIAYGDFEGVIPEGYGAGIVMLWDRGTWEPEVEDVDAALRKGDLKFRLNGYKLKGSWVLVRARFGGDPRGWLLIKHRDDWAGPVDITTFAPLSVKSAGDFEDIVGAKAPAVWKSARPARGGQAGKLLTEILERAAAKASGARTATRKKAPAKPRAPRSPRTSTTRRGTSRRPAPARPRTAKKKR